MSPRARRAPALLLLLAAAAALPACSALDAFCDTPGCEFSKEEWKRVQSLANPTDPPPDPSNRYTALPAAAALGQKLYFDPGFSGAATQVDALRRPVPFARAPAGAPVRLSCASCHDPARAGSEPNSIPGNVSVGAGWYDVNGQQTLNAAFRPLLFWDGRADSLWAQAGLENESPLAMNGNRLKDAWRLGDFYATDYAAAFAAPLPDPFSQGSAAYAASLGVERTPGAAGYNQCARVAGSCPAGCRQVVNPDTGAARCWPPFPLEGRPGDKPGCQAGDPTEPFDDAFDCMAPADRRTATGIFVNFTKALEAYEYRLVSRDSAFDRYVAEGSASTGIPAAARRGLRLFVGKASCIECHNGPQLSNGNTYNIGVPQTGPGVPTDADCPAGAFCDCQTDHNCLPWGAYDGLQKLQASKAFRRDGPWSDDPTDASRAASYTQELSEGLIGTWLTPSLRDVALTAPYMHDGVYRTLNEVVRHYNQGGAAAGFPGAKNLMLQPLYLSDPELADLVAFLGTLTGAPLPKELVTAPPGLPPP